MGMCTPIPKPNPNYFYVQMGMSAPNPRPKPKPNPNYLSVQVGMCTEDRSLPTFLAGTTFSPTTAQGENKSTVLYVQIILVP